MKLARLPDVKKVGMDSGLFSRKEQLPAKPYPRLYGGNRRNRPLFSPRLPSLKPKSDAEARKGEEKSCLGNRGSRRTIDGHRLLRVHPDASLSLSQASLESQNIRLRAQSWAKASQIKGDSSLKMSLGILRPRARIDQKALR